MRIQPDLGHAIDQLAEARETGRNLRPELALRHSEFGLVNMRIEAIGADLRATLNSRDPAFAPAMQAALAERTIIAPTDTGQSAQQRGSDQGGGHGPAGQGMSGQTGSGSDPRYGSSPGSGHASSKPYPGQDDVAGQASGAPTHRSGSSDKTEGRNRGVFA
ncbi:hypothetical protein [Erythrobacter sp. THAF29]|uniref:hypothetical protein n=1 Tax=Erythrobacter sp. THAF29 TaxID=2587851 RepID=UPI00126944CF|nr:hypothetical protein [Erythrobacter sp. THAF29]